MLVKHKLPDVGLWDAGHKTVKMPCSILVRFWDKQIPDSSRLSAVVIVVQPLGERFHAAFQVVAVGYFLLGKCEGAEVGKLVAECQLEYLTLCPPDILRKLFLVPCFTFAGKILATVCQLIAGFADSGTYC